MSLNVRAVVGRKNYVLSHAFQLVIATENCKGLKYQYLLSFGKCEKFEDKHFLEDL